MSQVEPETRGTWRQVAVVMDGKDIPVGRATYLAVTPEGYTVTVNGRVFQKGTATTVDQGMPRPTGVHMADVPHAGATIRQIFKTEGDVLIACNGQPDGPRPTEFASRPGSGHTLSVWLRAEGGRGAMRLGQWQLIVLVVLGLTFVTDSGVWTKDLEPELGHWGGLAAGCLITAAVIAVVGLLFRIGWRAGFVLGLTMSVTYATYQELRVALAPALHPLGVAAVSVSTAFVVGFVVGALLSQLLKPRWG